VCKNDLLIDIHTHIIPEHLPGFAEKVVGVPHIALEHHQPGCARIIRDGEFFREVSANCWDPKSRISDCDTAGVSVQVLSTIPVLFSYWASPAAGLGVSQFLNDHIGSVVAGAPDRFIGLGTLPLQAPELAIQEMERCKNTLGFPGVEIGTNINGVNLDSPSLNPFWEAAEDMGMAIFVHPWEMLGQERMPRYFLPWLVGMPAETALAICSIIFSGVLERFPNLRIAFAHGGGGFPFTAGRIQHGFDSRPDLCAVDNDRPPTDYLGKFYVDSLVHDSRALTFLIEQMGADRIAVGSDYPFPLGETRPGAILESLTDISEEQKQLLRSGSALQWLGMSQSSFV